jgi:hypothetical protein
MQHLLVVRSSEGAVAGAKGNGNGKAGAAALTYPLSVEGLQAALAAQAKLKIQLAFWHGARHQHKVWLESSTGVDLTPLWLTSEPSKVDQGTVNRIEAFLATADEDQAAMAAAERLYQEQQQLQHGQERDIDGNR